MAQFQACPKVHVKKCPARIPDYWFTTLEQNQKLSACCRDPRNTMTIEAWHSTQKAKDEGRIDIFIMQCTKCKCKHHRQMMGNSTVPAWGIA